MNEKIIERIRKMMAVANDAAASEGERDNAMRMSLKLLAKHNLSMAQVELAEEPEERGKIVDKDNNYPWRRQVANSIAQLFFCKYYYSLSGRWCYHNFVGLESNTATASEMSKYVIESIRKEGERWAKNNRGTPRDFAKGATQRIYERCRDLRREAEAESAAEAAAPGSTGTALVLASVYQAEEAANQALLDAMALGLRVKADRQRSADRSAYDAGKAFGDRVSLNRQVGTTGKMAQLN